MLRNKGCHLEPGVHEYAKFAAKPKKSFAQMTHSKICISLALCQFSNYFHSITGRTGLILKHHLPQHKCCRPNAEVDFIYEVHMLFTAKTAAQSDYFRILHQKESAGSLIRWSVCRWLRPVIRLILVQGEFDRSPIWKRICSKGTPQIRNPDPDPPKGKHPKIDTFV